MSERNNDSSPYGKTTVVENCEAGYYCPTGVSYPLSCPVILSISTRMVDEMTKSCEEGTYCAANTALSCDNTATVSRVRRPRDSVV